MDDDFMEDDELNGDDKPLDKCKLAARQLAKLNYKSREHHKRRKVVEDDLNESDYVNVTLENLELVPKDKTGRYKCGVCGTKNKYFSDMRRHVRNECIYCEKKYSCDICNKRFFRSGHVNQHKRKTHKLEMALTDQSNMTP